MLRPILISLSWHTFHSSIRNLEITSVQIRRKTRTSDRKLEIPLNLMLFHVQTYPILKKSSKLLTYFSMRACLSTYAHAKLAQRPMTNLSDMWKLFKICLRMTSSFRRTWMVRWSMMRRRSSPGGLRQLLPQRAVAGWSALRKLMISSPPISTWYRWWPSPCEHTA